MITAIVYALGFGFSLIFVWRNRDLIRWGLRVINAIRDKDENGNPIEQKHPLRDWRQRRKRK